ncbi:TetR/AcrR family transcriptional regulator [Undibacterium terreum]|uniref:TetR family transcriptional regulator n=1 Tax=Undibacterium terreum TaxID=1224302 RepID=A0A916XJN5_9BURK|nr:TetR/AcrR family transcriptional regulator [Undibacterium terreum]GGC75331.1 TetR family transcriptional regulator [Undibacterium terreum]
MKAEGTPNHRSRVAAERREKTRAKLLHSALIVFSQKGPHALIEDVIAHAGMARGSFYNYFKTNEELLVAVACEVNNELLRAIDPVVQCTTEPTERIACGARLLLRAVIEFPQFGSFVSRLPVPTANSSLLGIRFLARDVALGVVSDRFMRVRKRAAVDLVAGVVFNAAYSMAREMLEPDYPDAIVKAMLLGLGATESDATRIIATPLPNLVLPATSILFQAQNIQI